MKITTTITEEQFETLVRGTGFLVIREHNDDGDCCYIHEIDGGWAVKDRGCDWQEYLIYMAADGWTHGEVIAEHTPPVYDHG